MQKSNFQPIVGRSVTLRPLAASDTESIVALRNKPANGRFITRNPLTAAQHLQFFAQYQHREDDFYFVAESNESKRFLGTVAVYDWDQEARKAEWGRLVVDLEARFFALEIAVLSIVFAFEQLTLNKLYGSVQALNKAAHQFDLRLGFQEEGRLQHHYYNGAEVDDLILIAMFKPGFQQLRNRYRRLLAHD